MTCFPLYNTWKAQNVQYSLGFRNNKLKCFGDESHNDQCTFILFNWKYINSELLLQRYISKGRKDSLIQLHLSEFNSKLQIQFYNYIHFIPDSIEKNSSAGSVFRLYFPLYLSTQPMSILKKKKFTHYVNKNCGFNYLHKISACAHIHS